MTNSDPKIILALDFNSKNEVLNLVKTLNPRDCRLKVGMELFTIYGPGIVEELQKLGFEIFLDLKYHDIPNQVANACKAAANLGVWMLTVHALGGEHMLTQAVNSIANYKNRPKIVAVTMLTSLNDIDHKNLNFNHNLQTNVLHLAQLANNCGIDGVVCSANTEAKIMRNMFGNRFILVTPGIRLQTDNLQDQKRVVTPIEAMENGSSYLVIGRSITQANNPAYTLKKIYFSISEIQEYA